MWLWCEKGFFSAVQHRDKPQLVIVRARCRQHAEALADTLGIDRTGIIFTPDADYCCRIILTKATWGAFLKTAGEGIDYDNVKGNLGKNDHAYHDAMMRCWSAMNDFQGETEGVGRYVQPSSRR